MEENKLKYKYMKATQKLAVIKVNETPDTTDLNFIKELFEGTDYKPICVKDKVRISKGNLIIG